MEIELNWQMLKASAFDIQITLEQFMLVTDTYRYHTIIDNYNTQITKVLYSNN